MIQILLAIAAFLLMVGVLVAFHEYGHFWVARRCGVKVQRFSIGFGRQLLAWRDKYDTEYVISLIPLGGYVKMLDDTDGPLTDEQKKVAFPHQSLAKRVAIVSAGPIANFILAIFFFWIVMMWGYHTTIPRIGEVRPNSPAAVSGLLSGQEILAINGHETRSWQSIFIAFADELGSDDPIDFTVQKNGVISHHALTVTEWPTTLAPDVMMGRMGFQPELPEVPAIIGQVLENTPAADAGLQPGDVITHLNGNAVSWSKLVQTVQTKAGEPVQITVERGKTTSELTLTPKSVDLDGEPVGRIGVQISEKALDVQSMRRIHYEPLTAFKMSVDKTQRYAYLTLEILGKMVTGTASVDNLSGPVTMARGAGQTVQSGLIVFLSYLAIVSISLGVLNLLPIPILDGGHLLFYAIEFVTRRPVPPAFMDAGVRLGALLLFVVMSVALYNDIAKLFS